MLQSEYPYKTTASRDGRLQSDLKMRVDKRLKIFGAMKMIFNVRSVSLGVWKRAATKTDVWSTSVGYEDGWETQDRYYGNRVFVEYERSDQDGYAEELVNQAQSWCEWEDEWQGEAEDFEAVAAVQINR